MVYIIQTKMTVVTFHLVSLSGVSFNKHVIFFVLKGIENSSYTEKVGLVCFGEDTRVISRCCTNFSMLKQEISKLT